MCIRDSVTGVAGTWKDLTDNVNQMAANLTGQVRNIAEVTTAVASGDLSKKITVDVKGEILELKMQPSPKRKSVEAAIGSLMEAILTVNGSLATGGGARPGTGGGATERTFEKMVPLTGLEPVTPSLRMRCSTN